MGGKGSGRYPQGSRAGKVGTTQHENIVKFNKFITQCRHMAREPIDLSDPDAIYERYDRYVELSSEMGVEQTMTTFAKCLGTSISYISAVMNGSVRNTKWSRESLEAVSDVMECMEAFSELALLDPENKNAAQRIFHMKNRFGWRDTREQVSVNVKQELPAATDRELEAIRQKYIAQAGVVEVDAEVSDGKEG